MCRCYFIYLNIFKNIKLGESCQLSELTEQEEPISIYELDESVQVSESSEVDKLSEMNKLDESIQLSGPTDIDEHCVLDDLVGIQLIDTFEFITCRECIIPIYFKSLLCEFYCYHVYNIYIEDIALKIKKIQDKIIFSEVQSKYYTFDELYIIDVAYIKSMLFILNLNNFDKIFFIDEELYCKEYYDITQILNVINFHIETNYFFFKHDYLLVIIDSYIINKDILGNFSEITKFLYKSYIRNVF